jgi:hypothetical protein
MAFPESFTIQLYVMGRLKQYLKSATLPNNNL